MRDFKRKGFEVVWVSASKSEQGFNSYLSAMPWPALPFDRREEAHALQAQYGVRSFPSLVFVDAATGKVVAREACEKVSPKV